MERERLDALVCVQPRHVYYLSDHHSDWMFDRAWTSAAMFPASETAEPCLVVHDVELTALAERPSWMPGLATYSANVCGQLVPHFSIAEGATLDPLEARTLELLQRTGQTSRGGLLDSVIRIIDEQLPSNARIGLDDAEFASAVSARRPDLRLVDTRAVMAGIRSVKTPAELALMREAAARNQRALERAIGSVSPGCTWADVHRSWARTACDLDCMPVSLYVGAGRRSMGLHADETYRIVPGDQLCFDAMLTYQRYYGDMQRTCVLGEPHAALARAWQALETAAERAYDALRPGVRTDTVRELAISVAQRSGLARFRHAFVHGLGLEHLEHPADAKGFEPFTLEAGMVVNMDLELCELGFGGLYFEDTVVVRENGPERLYTMPRALRVIN
jgi:Xaa-Pro aminopeptidase